MLLIGGLISFTSDEGATKCNITDAQTTADTWAFHDSESKITITSGTGAIAYTMPVAIIGTLEESTFKFSYDDSLGNKLVTHTITFGKK